jgi:hypothetical protein
MTTIFISYARKDGEELAEFLHERLTGCGYDVWKDSHDLQIGRDFPRGISDALTNVGEFIILVSPAALQSEWVSNELNMALAAGHRILPIVLDGVNNNDIPLILKTKNYILMKGTDDWQSLNRLVDSLEGGSDIPRIYSMSNRDDTKFEGVLLLGKSEIVMPNLQDPADVIEKAEKMWLDFLRHWNKVDDLGLVPPGLAPLASAITAYLVGKPNQLPRLYYPYQGPDGKFRISAEKFIDLQQLRVFAQSK